MWNYLLIVTILCMNYTIMAHAQNELVEKGIGQTIYTEKEARKIAENFFLDVTNRKIDKYEINLSKYQEEEKWVYFIEGREEFLWFGNQWIVEVNKFTGEPEILEGE